MNLNEAKAKARRLARTKKQEFFVVRKLDGTYVIMGVQPLLGEWWHTYPDGMCIQRGSI